MNAKIILGILIIFCAVSQMLSVLADYSAGKFNAWPSGASFGSAAMVAAGIYIIRLGQKATKKR